MLTGWFHTQRQNLWTSLIAKIFFVKGNGLLRGNKDAKNGKSAGAFFVQSTSQLAKPFIGSFSNVLERLKMIIGDFPFQETYQAG